MLYHIVSLTYKNHNFIMQNIYMNLIIIIITDVTFVIVKILDHICLQIQSIWIQEINWSKNNEKNMISYK